MGHLWSIYSTFLINFYVGTGVFNSLEINLHCTSNKTPTQQSMTKDEYLVST